MSQSYDEKSGAAPNYWVDAVSADGVFKWESTGEELEYQTPMVYHKEVLNETIEVYHGALITFRASILKHVAVARVVLELTTTR